MVPESWTGAALPYLASAFLVVSNAVASEEIYLFTSSRFCRLTSQLESLPDSNGKQCDTQRHDNHPSGWEIQGI